MNSDVLAVLFLILSLAILLFGYRLRRVAAAISGFTLGVTIGEIIWLRNSLKELPGLIGLDRLFDRLASASELEDVGDILDSFFNGRDFTNGLDEFSRSLPETNALLTYIVPIVLGILIAIVGFIYYKQYFAGYAALSVMAFVLTPALIANAVSGGQTFAYVLAAILFAIGIGVITYMLVDISVIITTVVAGSAMAAAMTAALGIFGSGGYLLLTAAALFLIGLLAQLSQMRSVERSKKRNLRRERRESRDKKYRKNTAR
ncbi:MAG: hypothetical protein IKR85_08645 [Clostridia bacterium]|nr:hypothetical protein [Clostridia bacterium]